MVRGSQVFWTCADLVMNTAILRLASGIQTSVPLIGTDMSALLRMDDSRKRGTDEFDYRIHPSSS